jgi:hypothetical protein
MQQGSANEPSVIAISARYVHDLVYVASTVQPGAAPQRVAAAAAVVHSSSSLLHGH